MIGAGVPSPGAIAPLDWRTLPLDTHVLIEASAGTGKTWNIGLIYLRLLLERDLRVEQILVTTFTDAAAQELRERVRRRIVEAEHWLQTRVGQLDDATASGMETPSDPASLSAHLFALCPDLARAKTALRRIQLARADLDRAPISTIHALCQRIARDYPLESHAAFASDRLLDEGELIRGCVEDFWRRRYLVGAIDATEGEVVADAGPQALLRDVGALASCAGGAIEADGAAILREQLAALANSETIARLRALADDKTLYAPRKHALPDRLRSVATLLETGGDLADSLLGAPGKCFDAAMIVDQQSPSVGNRLLDDPLICRLRQLRTTLGLRTLFARGAVLAAAAADCREQVPQRARQRNVLTYSMLIDDVYARLCGRHADATLADRLYAAFPAALIDEFQDTDQRQFTIFDRIYRGDAGEARGTLVMIGDPKQAIYGFRGGDIAAYLRASAQAALRFSLATNHRSSTALVGALNALYGDEGGGFGTSGIDYRTVAAGGKADATPYAIDGVPVAAPLRIHLFRGAATDAKGDPLTSLTKLDALALDDCVRRIVEQLNDTRQTIDGRRVGPGDIAVLLSTNQQVAALRKRLTECGVPCVGNGRGSVFDSDVARDLELILHALVEADDERVVRGALSTRLLGAHFAQLRAWEDDTEGFERELERFERWRERVRSRGVLALVGEILALRAMALLSTGEGERGVTDLRHLGELLAEQEASHQGLEGLVAWFVAMRRSDGDGDRDHDDARRLRIESDAQRVQLLTIHASKGLEYPIVYLPLIWRIADRGGARAPSVLRFHDAAGQPRVDLGSARFVEHRARHFEEDLQERQRLLYVALTRARHSVHVYWVDRDVVGDGHALAATAWRVAAVDLLLAGALQRARLPCTEAALGELAGRMAEIAVEGPASPAGGTFASPAASDLGRATQSPLPAVRAFQWLHSFSSLVRQAAPALEAGAADETPVDVVVDAMAPVEEHDDPRLLALYPLRGPRFGDAVHSLLEQASPGTVWPAQRMLVARELAARAIRARDQSVGDAVEPVARLLDRIRTTDLGDGLRLADLAPAARVSEFEFQFPVHQVAVARLRRLCAAHGHGDTVPPSLDVITLNGMLTGFADLIFEWQGRYHVLDYKTNWLGARLAHYRGASLDAAMAGHHYDLQALLYTVALHRYLRQRLPAYTPETQLGQTWYLFVRALGYGAGLGVWRRQWPAALIDALDNAFAGVAERAA